MVESTSPTEARVSGKPDNTSVSKSAILSSVAGALGSRRSRTAAGATGVVVFVVAGLGDQAHPWVVGQPAVHIAASRAGLRGTYTS